MHPPNIYIHMKICRMMFILKNRMSLQKFIFNYARSTQSCTVSFLQYAKSWLFDKFRLIFSWMYEFRTFFQSLSLNIILLYHHQVELKFNTTLKSAHLNEFSSNLSLKESVIQGEKSGEIESNTLEVYYADFC